MTHKKLNLPTKICLNCQKSFSWRKKWQKDWHHVKYCSHKCQHAFSKNKKLAFILILLFFANITLSNNSSAQNMTRIDNQQSITTNVLNKKLQPCCFEPLTGFYRDGYCKTNAEDVGTHVVCAKVTDEFLQFTLSRGNDLITPNLRYNFPGLKDGDKWCLCALRWLEAYKAGIVVPVILESTHHKALEYIDLATLKKARLQKKSRQKKPQ
jgi:uncharacterized protein